MADASAIGLLQQSPWIGGLACAGGNIAVAAAPAGVSHVVASSIVGAFDLTVANDAIFGDGFDGD